MCEQGNKDELWKEVASLDDIKRFSQFITTWYNGANIISPLSLGIPQPLEQPEQEK